MRQRRISLQECQQRCGLHEIQLHGHRGTPLIRVDCFMSFRRVRESGSLRVTVHVCARHSQHIKCAPELVRIWRHRCPKIPAAPDAHFRRHRHEWSPHESPQTELSQPDRGQIPTIKDAPQVSGEKKSRGCNQREYCVIGENNERLLEVHLEIPALVRGVEL